MSSRLALFLTVSIVGFVVQSEILLNEETAKKLQFQWTSPLADQSNKFYTLKELQMERVMVR